MPIEFIIAISKVSNEALDKAEADMAAALAILKTIGGSE